MMNFDFSEYVDVDLAYALVKNLLFLLIIISSIYIIQRMLQRIITKAVAKTEKVSIDVANGLKILIRLTAGISILYAFIFVFGLPSQISFALSTFLGAAISFASIQSIQNFIAGFYLLFNRPFEIKDLIKINKFEGEVIQITLNYTKIRTFDGAVSLIPNRNILTASITNYSRKIKKEQKEQPRLKSLKILSDFIYTSKKEIVRYALKVALPVSNVSSTKKKIQRICDDFTETFGYQPKFYLYSIDNNLWFNIIIMSDDVKKVIDHLVPFSEKINAQFY